MGKSGSLSSDSTPGFAHALMLSYNTISKERYSADVEKKTLTYAYQFGDDVTNNNKPSVGLLSALQDELGTQAMFGAGLPCPPGASLQMCTELVDKKNPIEANPMGAMHGGCVAMVMEQVAEPYAKHALGVDSVVLESMNVEFLGAVRLGGKHAVVDVECETIGMDENNNVLIVNALQRRGTRIVWDAILKFSPRHS